ncbi:MAG: pyrroline-5-carboxylate reductase [Lachnospiraceae bacterium]|nr:pyrroline-5-carboxylate reductase [Lachnospiraceae bacterium]
MKKLGFIGCGNMAKAIMGGIIGKGLLQADEIIASDVYRPMLEGAKAQYGICITDSNLEVVENCEMLLLAVKPQYYESVIKEVTGMVRPEQIVITIAPGKTLEWLRDKFGKDVKIVRLMPNTPAMVMEGMTAAVPNALITKDELAKVMELLNSFGKAEVVSEHLMDTVTSVSGSSPAYVFMFIEAMADAAVADGMPRAQAYKFAAQAVMGSAKMVLETGKHPAELKDMVCSPGGTTIEAVRVLEAKGMRSAVFEAMKACAKKSASM